MRIDRCYCFKKTFAELCQRAAETGSQTLEELQAHVQFGERCKLCHPYIRRSLHTGETAFSEILTEDPNGPKQP